MPLSAKYNAFKARISQIENHLLPAINPAGAYSDKDQDLIRSYCLLCHAEIESYIEEYTLEIVTRSYNIWFADKTNVSPFIFQLAHGYSGKKEPLYSMIIQSYNTLRKNIEGNNGIKDHNLVTFFKPIGYELDPALQVILNDFGKLRGEIAHSSFRTQQPLDPVNEKSKVNLILTGLNTFDQELDAFENSGIFNKVPTPLCFEKFGFLDRIKILFTGKF